MSEETQKVPVDPERENLIAEMLRDANKTELPSELDKEPVIHRGDEILPAPMVKARITSAGYVYIWDTRTYHKAPVLYYMLAQKLRERRPDGSYRWTVNDPGKEPKRGEFKCLLHKGSPNRARYDSLGFRVCPKDNLANAYEVRRHMQLKHKAEWAAIEEERKEQERKEDRELQRLLITRVAETPKPAPELAPDSKFVCGTCGKKFAYAKAFRKHVRSCK